VAEPLSTVIIVALAVTTLYVGRDIFVPIAIAILVSFVLSPPILLLRRAGFGRVVSVTIVVTSALVIAFSASAVLTRQVSAFVTDLPQYQATINFKLDELRNAAAENALFAKVSVWENLNRINRTIRSRWCRRINRGKIRKRSVRSQLRSISLQ
jgi:predicted PurR-regulated permease PerM